MGALERIGRAVGLMPRRRFLPGIELQDHVICTGESVAMSLRRITTEEFTQAIAVLTDPEVELGEASATASAGLGRISALLRLVRSAIGDDTCAAELKILREADAFLVGLTAGQGEVRALDEIRARYDSALRPEALSDLRDQLLHRHQVLRLEQLPALERGGALEHWLQQLRRSRARFGAWPIEEPMHGQQPIPDSFDAFAEGLERSYHRGRKRSGKTDTSPTKWRRDVSDLGHQIELLSGAWPAVMAATVASATSLADVLTEYARADALRAAVASDPSLMIDDTTTALVVSLCEHECSELMEVASVLSTRLYAEAPGDFVTRIERYWTTRN